MINPELTLPSVNLENIMNLSKHYLTGIAWVYRYYQLGTSNVNIKWFYRTFHAPLFTDIFPVLNNILAKESKVDLSNGTLLIPKFTENITNVDGDLGLSPIHQLLSVLPKYSERLLPPEVLALTEPMGILGDLYPTEFNIELDGKDAEWQGEVIIPMVDPDRVIDAVSQNIKFSPERSQLFQEASRVTITRDLRTNTIINKQRAFQQHLNRAKTYLGRDKKPKRDPGWRSSPRRGGKFRGQRRQRTQREYKPRGQRRQRTQREYKPRGQRRDQYKSQRQQVLRVQPLIPSPIPVHRKQPFLPTITSPLKTPIKFDIVAPVQALTETRVNVIASNPEELRTAIAKPRVNMTANIGDIQGGIKLPQLGAQTIATPKVVLQPKQKLEVRTVNPAELLNTGTNNPSPVSNFFVIPGKTRFRTPGINT